MPHFAPDDDDDERESRVSQRDEDTYVVDHNAHDELDPDNVTEDRVENDLPRLHESERDGSFVEKLKYTLGELDGPMALSQATVPKQAEDIGDTDERANPRAGDLGYPEGYELAVEHDGGRVVFSDPPNWALAGESHMHADEADVISDVTEWA